MSFTMILKITSCMYIVSLMLEPDEMINKTAQFLSMVFVPVDSSNRLAHVARCFVLLIRFVVLFILISVNTIHKLSKNPVCREKIKIHEKKAHIISQSAITNTPMHSAAETLQATKADTEPMTVLLPINTLNDQSIEQDNNHKSLSQLEKSINDTITTNVVTLTLAQDQLIEDMDLHVTTSLPTMQPKDIVQQPERTIPFVKEDDEHMSFTAAKSTAIILPTESNDPKERFYSDLIKKDSDIHSFSDNLKRIFDEPIMLPQLQKSDTNLSRPISVQHSLEGMITTTTPALTPPHLSSASSRRSSVTTMGGKLQTAVKRISRIGSRHSQTVSPQQQTIDLNTSPSIKKRNRFSTISRLGRKKSTISTLSDHNNQKPEMLSVEASKKARGIRNTIKRTGKKLTSFLTPNQA